jgi:CRISPR-associated protein Csx14
LTNARPQRVSKLEYRYGAIAAGGSLIDPIILRAALGCGEMPFPQRSFRMRLGWPGKENQARCIIDVIEETRS